jgi:HemY protein
MNRLLYVLLLSAMTIAGFTMYQQNDLGYISMRFAGHSFETNLVVLTAALLCLLFATLLLVKLFHATQNLLAHFGSKRQLRLEEKARHSLALGLIEYAEGRFEQAEKILLQQVDHSDNRLLVYLSAARAAQQLGAHERRDEYLRKAHIEAPDADIAIGLTKAELQLAHDQNEQALATLTQLNSMTENHRYVITLLANTYQHLGDWDNLKTILPQLKKYGNLSTESFLAFEIRVCKGQMSNIAKRANINVSGSKQIIDFWSKESHHLKALPAIVEHYARLLVSLDASGEAEHVLRHYLNKNWEDSTIILYSELDVMVDNSQLEMAESWLEAHQHNCHLLLALGKMCISRSLWGKARNYLEASIAINPMPENYLKLARLLEEHMDEAQAAQEYYRQGLHLLAGDYGEEVLDKDKHDFERETPQLKIVKT